MASLNGKYDPDAELPQDREMLDAGTYKVELTESDVVPTKNGKGQLFKYTASVVDGDAKGRLIWGQMNLENENATAQDIGQKEFKALRVVTGVQDPEDTQDLHYKQFDAVVKVEPAKGEFKAKNAIDWAKTVKVFNGEEVGTPPAGKDETTPPVKAANDNKPAANTSGKKSTPWGKKAAA